MNLGERSEFYEVGELLETIGRTRIHAARDKSTGTAVVYHKISLEGAEADEEAILIDLRQEALLLDARVPLLVDAWIVPDHIGYVRLEYPGNPLDSMEGRSLLHQIHGTRVIEETAFESLAALAALHEQTITHKRLRASSYRVTPAGLVFLRDTGLWERVEKHVSTGSHGFGFALVANWARIDVACWAGMITSLVTNMEYEIVEEDGRLSAALREVERMQDALRSSKVETNVAEMLCQALEAFANGDAGGFENGPAAMKAFPRTVLA